MLCIAMYSCSLQDYRRKRRRRRRRRRRLCVH
jgi:hypothetical protein